MAKSILHSSKMINALQINIKGKLYTFDKPKVMGILNLTPDSFFDGGKYRGTDAIRQRIDSMIAEGADIIDIGGCSTRPGAAMPSADEEWHRLSEGFEIINKYHPDSIVSVDTFRASVAKLSVEQGGAAIVNDISGGDMDANMFSTIAQLHVPYILMHIKGTPQNMQNNPQYTNVTDEVIKYLSERVRALRQLGVADIIIDPGFGFGKTVEHNYQLLRQLSRFEVFNMPILAAISRKSMIYKVLGTDAQHSLNGTTALNMIALANGAHLLRVHDVKEAKECIALHEMLK